MARRSSVRLVRRAYLIVILERNQFDPLSKCSRMALLLRGALRRISSSRSGESDRARGAQRGSAGRDHRVAARFPILRQYQVIAEPEGTVVGSLDEISRSRAWPAIFSCWEPPPGGSVEWRRAASAWRMRTGRRRPFPSGWARRRAHMRAFHEVSRLREDILSAPRPSCSSGSALDAGGQNRRSLMFAPGSFFRCHSRAQPWSLPNDFSMRAGACSW